MQKKGRVEGQRGRVKEMQGSGHSQGQRQARVRRIVGQRKKKAGRHSRGHGRGQDTRWRSRVRTGAGQRQSWVQGGMQGN